MIDFNPINPILLHANPLRQLELNRKCARKSVITINDAKKTCIVTTVKNPKVEEVLFRYFACWQIVLEPSETIGVNFKVKKWFVLQYLKIVLPHIGLMVLCILYTFAGATVFYLIERPHEDHMKAQGRKEVSFSNIPEQSMVTKI